MNRRQVACMGLLLTASGVRASHPWRPYQGAPPLYIEGTVRTLLWNDPHPHLRMVHEPGQRLPTDLQARGMLPHRDADRTARLLSHVVVPVFERAWRVELPTLAKLLEWGVERPAIGETVGVVGLPGPEVQDTATMQAVVLFIDGKGYPLGSTRA